MIVSQLRPLKKLARSSIVVPIVLLAASAFACGGTAADDAGGGGAATPRTQVPAPLSASWYSGNVSSVNFHDPATGAWGAPSGTGMFFVFTPDGYYEKGVLLQSSMYGCTMTFTAYNSGTMTVAGDRFVLYPTYGRVKSVDNCVQANNYDRPDQLESETILWELGPDEYGIETLWLRYEGGSPSAFHQG